MERLPSGLEGMYRHIMTTMCDALGAERPDLLTLLRGGVLPVLVAARDLLSVASVAWACGAEPHDVALLARLLPSLFPRRAAGSGETTIESEIMYPYHKTVLDWLRCEEKMDAKEFKVNVGTGHLLFVRASLDKKTWLSSGSTGAYALRHAVTHACQAGDAKLLQGVLLNFTMWEAIDLGHLWCGTWRNFTAKCRPSSLQRSPRMSSGGCSLTGGTSSSTPSKWFLQSFCKCEYGI